MIPLDHELNVSDLRDYAGDLEPSGWSLWQIEAAIQSRLDEMRTTVVELGLLALEMRRRPELWKDAGYASSDAYFWERWQWSDRRVRQFIQAAEIAEAMRRNNCSEPSLPKNEGQYRELAPLRDDPSQLVAAWSEVRDRFGEDVTAANIHAVVRERLEREPQPAFEQAPVPSVHFSSDSAEWYTPNAIIERASAVLGGIDLDPCSNSKQHPTVPARAHFTVADDGLAQPWHGTVYMNPPYGNEIGAWAGKLIAEYAAGRVEAAIALVPARTDTAWFRRFRDFPVCFIAGRLRFSGHENSAPFPSAIFYLGAHRGAFVPVFSDLGDIYERVAQERNHSHE